MGHHQVKQYSHLSISIGSASTNLSYRPKIFENKNSSKFQKAKIWHMLSSMLNPHEVRCRDTLLQPPATSQITSLSPALLPEPHMPFISFVCYSHFLTSCGNVQVSLVSHSLPTVPCILSPHHFRTVDTHRKSASASAPSHRGYQETRTRVLVSVNTV